jgi:hypothetical protein
VVNPTLYGKVPYEFGKDFDLVSLAAHHFGNHRPPVGPSRPYGAQLCPASRQSNRLCWRCLVEAPMVRSAQVFWPDGPRGGRGRNSHW